MSLKRYAFTVFFLTIAYILFNFSWLYVRGALSNRYFVFLWCQVTTFYVLSVSLVDVVGFLFDRRWTLDKMLAGRWFGRRGGRALFPLFLFLFFLFCVWTVAAVVIPFSQTVTGGRFWDALPFRFLGRLLFPYLPASLFLAFVFSYLLMINRLCLAGGDIAKERRYEAIASCISEGKTGEILDLNVLLAAFFLVLTWLCFPRHIRATVGAPALVVCAAALAFFCRVATGLTCRAFCRARTRPCPAFRTARVSFGIRPAVIWYWFFFIYLIIANLQLKRVVTLMQR